jgi:hypothetical protein
MVFELGRIAIPPVLRVISMGHDSLDITTMLTGRALEVGSVQGYQYHAIYFISGEGGRKSFLVEGFRHFIRAIHTIGSQRR